MASLDKQKVQLTKYNIVILATLFAFAILIRCNALGVDGFGMDEVFGASYANLNLLEIVVAVLRFDIHPPLYYLQLGAWSSFSHSDNWLLANSIVWSAGTFVAAAYGLYRLNISGVSIAAATIAAAYIAVLGSEVYYASELRMYAMISFMVVLAWIRSDLWLEEQSVKNTVWLILVLGLLACVHSVAFLPISCVLIYLISSWRGSIRSAATFKLVLIVGVVGLFLLPWLLNASMRSVSHTKIPSVDVVITTFAGWILGYGNFELPDTLKIIAGYLIVAVAAIVMWFGDRKTVRIIFSFVVWPALLLAAMSFLVRPVWIERAVAFCAPFFIISVALFVCQISVTEPNKRRIYTVFLALLFIVLSFMAFAQSGTSRKMQYREAADLIVKENSQHSAIYIPQNVTFWGVTRYISGPRWGSMLDIQDATRPDKSEKWTGIYAKLGPVWLERLHLMPSNRFISSAAGPIWTGWSPLPDSVRSKGVFVVGDNEMTEGEACGGKRQDGLWKFRGVVVFRCAAE